MDDLYQFLSHDLGRVKSLLEDAFQVEGALMQEVAEYVAGAQGKLLRPAIVCLSARAHGYDGDSGDHHVLLGAAIELFHVATLLHDDVIDKAPLRRGRPTVNSKWGDDVAILFADYLYATSFDYALATLNSRTLRILTQTTQRMTEGEFLQIERRGEWLTVDDYHEIIMRKTAYLFSASASLGSVIAGADEAAVLQMANYGLEFGLAFQITDDALDYEAQGDKWGKRVGADLADGKQTLPLLRALSAASQEDRKALLRVLNNGRDFQTVHRYVKKYEGVEYSLGVAGDHARTALESLSHLPEQDEAVVHLRQIADHVLVRQY